MEVAKAAQVGAAQVGPSLCMPPTLLKAPDELCHSIQANAMSHIPLAITCMRTLIGVLQLCRIPNWGPLWVALAPPGQPDKQRLMDVKDFFAYTEKAGEAPTAAKGCHELMHTSRAVCTLGNASA